MATGGFGQDRHRALCGASLSGASDHPPPGEGHGVWEGVLVCAHHPWGHTGTLCHAGSSDSSVGPELSAPPWAGAIFSSQEMSQVWGQVDERDCTGDQGSSGSLREVVELDIQDLQACSSAVCGRPFHPHCGDF